MSDIENYAHQIRDLSTAIFAECEVQRRGILTLQQALWESCHSGVPVRLEKFGLIPQLGGIMVGSMLEYATTPELSGRYYSFTRNGYISKINTGIEEQQSLIRNVRHASRFVANPVDYRYVVAELEYGLAYGR